MARRAGTIRLRGTVGFLIGQRGHSAIDRPLVYNRDDVAYLAMCSSRRRSASASRDLAMVRLYPAGTGHFKNVVYPVTSFEIEDARHPIAHRAFDPVCRMRLYPHRAPAYMPFEFRVYCFC